MRRYSITNLKELQDNRIQLKIDYLLLEKDLKKSGKDYIMQFSPKALFEKFTSKNNIQDANKHFNLVGNALSFLLPMLLRKTIFRGSGFITKAIVGLLSKKVGQSLTAHKFSEMFDSAKHWVEKKISARPVKKQIDYGIPPDSETY